MQRSTFLTVAAIIQVVTLSAVTALDAGRYTIGRGGLFLIPGPNNGDVMAKAAGADRPVWILGLDSASAGAGTTNTLYTFQFEAAVSPQRFMTYDDTAAAGTRILTKPTPRPFCLQLVNSETGRHRILPPPPENNLAIRGGDGELFAEFGVVKNDIITEKDFDMWNLPWSSER